MSTSRPVIAVVGRKRAAGEVHGWTTSTATVMQDTYLEALWRSGADELVIAPRLTDEAHLERVLSRVDGLLLAGGPDVDPARYGQDRHPTTYGVDERHDATELAACRVAVRTGLPLLAICRGMQVLCVALGGSLTQHIGDLPTLGPHGNVETGPIDHAIDVVPGSLLSDALGGATRLEHARSWHHQVVDRLPAGAVITGRTADGCPEAMELTGAPGWVLAVQWHPERLVSADDPNQRLFDALIEQASRRSVRAAQG